MSLLLALLSTAPPPADAPETRPLLDDCWWGEHQGDDEQQPIQIIDDSVEWLLSQSEQPDHGNEELWVGDVIQQIIDDAPGLADDPETRAFLDEWRAMEDDDYAGRYDADQPTPDNPATPSTPTSRRHRRVFHYSQTVGLRR